MRNLDTSINPARWRGLATSKDDTPYGLDSPTKRRLRNENHSLKHSHSSSDLTLVSHDQAKNPTSIEISSARDGQSPGRPTRPRPRRRSTILWSTASPRARQQKLEDLAVHRLADTWFTLHPSHDRSPDPFYISEVMEHSMNPDFAFFDLENIGLSVSRADECMLKVWAKDGRSDAYRLLVELTVNLRSLQFVGKSLEHFHHPLPQNSILFHLEDGIYTSFTDLPAKAHEEEPLRNADTVPTATGSSFDALMQLANLEECIQDALTVRSQIEDEVNTLLSQPRALTSIETTVAIERDEVSATRSAFISLRKQIVALRKRNNELKEGLQGRVTARTFSSKDSHQVQETQKQYRKLISEQVEDIKTMSEASHGQIRRIGETLLTIFPIDAVKNKALQFAIRGIFLPNSTFDDTNRDEIAAALGFTAQLVHLLSLYLSTPLPYPIDGNASNPFIEDPISMSLAQRRYPLHPTNIAYKFEYAVFLLNKDIEFLMNKASLRVLDIRHTLPNLKYLLYVLTAGAGELPARKAGGVRGLLGGRITPSISRRGSEDSVRGHKEFFRTGSLDLRRNGNISPVPSSKEKAGETMEPLHSPPRAPGFAHRQSGLRDNG